MMENRYSQYLPETVKELKEFQKLAEIEGIILEEAAAAREKTENNQWILTAEKSGLLRLAKMMGFLGAEALETEALRKEILYRWNSQSPYTRFHLLDWLDGCLGKENYCVSLEQESYFLHLLLELRVKEKQDFLQRHLRKMIPANLKLEVDLHVNTYEKVSILTHGQMKEWKWTYGQIPLEDLTPYQNEKA